MMFLFFSSQKSMDADSSLSSGSQLEDCSEPASGLFSDDLAASSSQLGCVSSCGSSLLSQSSMPAMDPPSVSLPPLYTSSTQNQPESISAELSSGVTLTCIYDIIIVQTLHTVSIALDFSSLNG